MATNCNPGSAPTVSMPMIIALAVRHCGLRVPEAIHAVTINAATVLGLRDRGIIAPGMRADMVLLRHRDERELAYEFGSNPVDMVFLQGVPA
jgi:imidazolonepropionase